MKRLMILGAVWALAMARPEQYKEKEDFQYSRSSSDDGTKSGFYGAQRGNMGGNYERAHNMDSLAQNQMSGLVKQVEGELGDGANTRAGSVYTAANSRGTYGSGHFDLSNLAGRNFQEGATFDDSASHHSSSSAYNAADYANSRSHSSRSRGMYSYGGQSSHSSGYNAQSGYQQQTAFDTSNADLNSGGYGSNIHTRLISATPVRIVGRPGTRVAIPIAAQTYDSTHGYSLMDQNSLNSDAEVLNTDTQHTVYRPAKHYESSYNYRKQWEKHDTIPGSVFVPATSTENPFPKNSELYEDSQAHTASHQYDARRVDSQRAHSSNVYSGYNANVKSTSGQSRSDYDTQHTGDSTHDSANAYTVAGYNRGSSHHDSSADHSSNGYNMQSQYNTGRSHGAVADVNSLIQAQNGGFSTDLNSQVESLNTKPKSYHSSYSYHKSWERQGDPYVIKPASAGYYDGQAAQMLTTKAATGSHYQHSHNSGADCDENGHIRVARSYNADQYQDMQQQSQNLEDLGQQVEDLGQRQNLEDLGQQVEDLGQQTQSLWGQQEAGQQVQNTWDNLEDLSQQSHNNWDEIHHTWDKFEDLGQNPQDINKQISNLEQKNQNDLGQRRQHTTTELNDKKQDQEAQNEWDIVDQQQEDKPNDHTHNQHHEQSNVFDQQVNQPGTTDDDIFSQYSQTSNKLNNDKNNQMSVWDKLDFGSFQNNQRNKKEDENFSGHQTNSGSISQNTFLDQVPVNTVSIADLTQSEHHHVNDNSGAQSVWQQIGSNDQQPDINLPSNTGLFDLNNEHLHSQYQFRQNQLQKDENAFQQTHRFHDNHNWNSFSSSHRQEQTTNTESFTHVNSFGANSQNSAPLSSIWGKLGNVEQFDKLGKEDIGGGYGFTHVSSNSQNDYENSRRVQTHNLEGSRTSSSQEHLNNQMKPFYDLINHINEKNNTETNDNSPKAEEESSLDTGRGDIGPEVVSNSKPYQHSIDTPVNVETIQNSNQKPIKEIDIDLPAHELSVLGLKEQNPLVQNKQNENSATNTNKTHTQSNYQGIEHRENVNIFNSTETNENLHQQHSYNLGHHMNVNHDYLKPQDVSTSGQESLTHLHDSGNNENLEQQSHQQHDKAEQQNLHDFGQQVNLEQQNLQDFGQQTNLEQQNLQDFGQQVNLEQQNLQDFGQQANLEQQNVQDFGHQANLEQQNLQDFGQQANLEQQNLQDFGQQVNLEQQNLQDFGQQANLEQQNLQDFGQQVNLEQQNLQDFGQHANLEQQNLQGFGQQGKLEQQNLQDFGQQAYLEQQNLQAFGQQVNSEQQNLQGFRQQENLDQQNLHDLGQHIDLEQQNLHDLGQHIDLEQQNIQNIRRQYTHPKLEIQDFNQNQNVEQLSQNSEQDFKYSEKHEQPMSLPKNNVQSHTYFPPTDESEEQKQIILPKQNNMQSQQRFPPPAENDDNILVKKEKNDLQATAPNLGTEVPPQIESVTEKPGFWKSIGNKLSRAKSKISSWF